MIVLHVAAPAAVGGLERVVQALSRGQRDHGIAAHVAAVLPPSGADHRFLDPLREAGVPVHPVFVEGRSYLKERATIADLCRELAPDVVHTHGYRPDVVDAPAARRLGIPTATTLHGFTRGRWRKRLFERLQRSACRRFNAVVAVSRPIAAELVRAGVARDRVHVVPNAWREWQPPLSRDEARRRLGVSNDEFLIGWVGRLSGEKGPDVLVRAMPYLRIPRAVACFIGAGPERGTLAELARQLGVPDQIRWPGELLEAGRLFPGFDVFVLTSRTEGTPIVLFEAMAAEVPIIATRAGGVPDTVADSDALLVPPEDPGALAAAIGEVWADRAGASARAQAAQKRLLTDFEPNRWISRYAAIYERLVAARARDPAWV